MQARATHKQLPSDAIQDRHGRPSTDPRAFLNGGFLLPFGGHKGYALAVIAELLSGPISGADAYPGVTSRSGIFIFAVDATVFRPSADYEKTLAKTLGRIKAVPPGPGFDVVLLPGEPEARFRVRRERDGIPIPEDTWRAVCEVGGELGVNVDKNDVNPIAALMAGKMMFEYLGEAKTAARLEKALIDVLTEGRVRTYDLGGHSSTTDVGGAIAEKLRSSV